ncbi:hypothetical protein [Alistipes sp.]|nr:hypothetical protein [Alistipes sp.]
MKQISIILLCCLLMLAEVLIPDFQGHRELVEAGSDESKIPKNDTKINK